MTIDERRIYDLVVRRFLAVLYPAYEYEQTSIIAESGGERFTAHGNIVKSAGWKAVYEEQDEPLETTDPESESECSQNLPELSEGDSFMDPRYITDGRKNEAASEIYGESSLICHGKSDIIYGIR